MVIHTAQEAGCRFVDTSRTPRARARITVLHHTVTPNRAAEECPVAEHERAYALVRQIQGWHFANGWIDLGYHFLISAGGVIVEGRHGSIEAARRGLVVQGAHSGNNYANRVGYGVALEGLFTDELPTQAQQTALVELCAHLSFWGGTQARDIFPHRKYRPTECPGEALFHALSDLGQRVRDRKIEMMKAAGTWPY